MDNYHKNCENEMELSKESEKRFIDWLSNLRCYIPNDVMEDKKMRFKKEFMGTFRSEKMFRVKDCENEAPFNDILAEEYTIDKTVRWLNDNIKYDEMSFDEYVEKAISELWSPDEIAYSNIDGEYVIHEKKSTGVLELDIKDRIPFKVSVEMHYLDSSRCVYIIKEKKNGC